ncbi:hypothetical protein CFBP6411_04666 [Pseudomonas syringae group genomosp. 3]|uniref:Uncharacterized protein n=1 Tax=Pseudomonas syringae group genomosp. 3 TaxID=251701 RepID=A0A2K4WJE2_9PSED|nr:hypothetical protein CFBP6411_04666 [Pseudomonas syringae group genomosp. 3]
MRAFLNARPERVHLYPTHIAKYPSPEYRMYMQKTEVANGKRTLDYPRIPDYLRNAGHPRPGG